MVVRSLAVLAVLAGCYREAAAPVSAPPPGAPATEDAGWPTSLEFEMADRTDVLKHHGLAMFSIETTLPVFRSEPPAIAAALDARLARLARPDVDPATHEGRYELDCTVELANRYAVVLGCEQMLDERTHEEAAQGTGGAPAGPHRVAFGWWLRRGLPDLSLEQFAPEYDLRAVVEAAAAVEPPGCDLRGCAFDPKSFLLDGEGITAVATEDCASACDALIPTIELDHLAPTHAWAGELVKRIRRRAEAGETLVEGAHTN